MFIMPLVDSHTDLDKVAIIPMCNCSLAECAKLPVYCKTGVLGPKCAGKKLIIFSVS